MSRTRATRRTVISEAPATASISSPESEPLTRTDFDSAIAVLERLSAFAQARSGSVMHESADLQRSITRLELYRDWWTAPQGPDATPAVHGQPFSPDAAARIAELEEEVRSWRGYSRRNEDRAKKAQHELDQIKTTRRRR